MGMYITRSRLKQCDIRAEIRAQFTAVKKNRYLANDFQNFNREFICNNTDYQVDAATNRPFLSQCATHEARRPKASDRPVPMMPLRQSAFYSSRRRDDESDARLEAMPGAPSVGFGRCLERDRCSCNARLRAGRRACEQRPVNLHQGFAGAVAQTLSVVEATSRYTSKSAMS